MTRIEVLINCTSRHDTRLHIARLEDADGPIEVGQVVTAFELGEPNTDDEPEYTYPALVKAIDHDRRLIYLAVAVDPYTARLAPADIAAIQAAGDLP